MAINRATRNVDNESPNNRLSWPQFYQRTRTSSASTKTWEEDRRRKDTVTAGSSGPSGLERLAPDDARAIQRANQIVMYVSFSFCQQKCGAQYRWWWISN